jgi:hypothetical protein
VAQHHLKTPARPSAARVRDPWTPERPGRRLGPTGSASRVFFRSRFRFRAR